MSETTPNIIRLAQNDDSPAEASSVVENLAVSSAELIEVKQIGFAGKILATLKWIPGMQAILDVLVVDGRHPADIQAELIQNRQEYSRRLSGLVATNDNSDSPKDIAA